MRSPSTPLRASTQAGILATGILACGLAGCGSSSSDNTPAPPTTPTTYSGVGFSGKAMAGKQPLVGASVQLYAAGTTGSGSSGTALLTSALTTDANGAFTVPAGYICPADTSQLYLVARGGQAGAAANTAIVFLTVLGPCDQIAASSQFVTNEVTTVAAAYALAQLLSSGANLGASSTNSTGLGNAVATAQALGSITTGSSPGPSFAANGASPAAAIDSVANLLNACAVATPAVHPPAPASSPRPPFPAPPRPPTRWTPSSIWSATPPPTSPASTRSPQPAPRSLLPSQRLRPTGRSRSTTPAAE